MTELILIRHGETDWNRELRFQGQVDVALNGTGHEQARRIAARLAAQAVDLGMAGLYVSDLLRARQTAQPLAEALDLPMQPEASLREQSFGDVDGMRVDDIKLQHPKAWEEWLRFQADYAMPGGETTRAFHARVTSGILRLAAERVGQTLVVVTHGGVLDMIYRSALSLGLDGPRQSEIPNGGLNRVRVSSDGFEILAWADVAHLAGMPAQPIYDQKKLLATQPSPSAV